MNRRNLIRGVAALPMPAPAAKPMTAIFELRSFRLRNGAQIQRTSDFLSKYYLPAAQRLGIGPLGFFNALIGEQSPFVMSLTSYPSISAMEIAMEKMASDKEFQKGAGELNSAGELSYIRMENSVLRAFDSIPGIEV